jgi:hypothetical protein
MSIDRELAFLKDLFIRAITWGKATMNPVKQVRLFREDNARTRFLTEQAEARLFAHCNSQPKPQVMTSLAYRIPNMRVALGAVENVDFRIYIPSKSLLHFPRPPRAV